MDDKSILFIGPYSKTPSGGVAFVIHEYEKLFPHAYFVASMIPKNAFTKIYGFVFGIIKMSWLLLTHSQIKIIHIHGASYNSFTRKAIIHKIGKLFQKKVIYHIHGAEYQLFYENSSKRKKKQIEQFINNVDCLVCLSESWRSFFLLNFEPQKLEVIPNIIGAPSISKKTTKGKPVKFLFLGFVDKRKGVWFLLETLREHKESLTDKAIFYIGGNGRIPEFKQRVQEYGLNDLVKYIGWVSGESKQKHLKNADIYVLPSYNEGLPISILEAMSYKLPILSTKVGGIPEIVSSENGKIIDPGAKKQLLCAIKFFINSDEEQLNAMGNKSFEKVKAHLPEQVKNRLTTLYRHL